jgi:hypothetical protein
VTTTEAIAALVAAGRIKSGWLPGMQAASPDGTTERYAAGDGPWLYGDRVHDINDPLTARGLELLVEEACPGAVPTWQVRLNPEWFWFLPGADWLINEPEPTREAATEAALVALAEAL